MADRVVIIDFFEGEIGAGSKLGHNVTGSFEFVPITKGQNVFKVYAAYVDDADLNALIGDTADNALAGVTFP